MASRSTYRELTPAALIGGVLVGALLNMRWTGVGVVVAHDGQEALDLLQAGEWSTWR